jgi:hypothetical protein
MVESSDITALPEENLLEALRLMSLATASVRDGRLPESHIHPHLSYFIIFFSITKLMMGHNNDDVLLVIASEQRERGNPDFCYVSVVNSFFLHAVT